MFQDGIIKLLSFALYSCVPCSRFYTRHTCTHTTNYSNLHHNMSSPRLHCHYNSAAPTSNCYHTSQTTANQVGVVKIVIVLPTPTYQHPTTYNHKVQCLPFQQFQVLFTLFSKFFSSFPHGTCSLSVSNLYLAFDGFYHLRP